MIDPKSLFQPPMPLETRNPFQPPMPLEDALCRVPDYAELGSDSVVDKDFVLKQST
jgi:hypothetical protein